MVEQLTSQSGSGRLELQEQPKMINQDMKLTMYQVSLLCKSRSQR
jgi:hypothetical protein